MLARRRLAVGLFVAAGLLALAVSPAHATVVDGVWHVYDEAGTTKVNVVGGSAPGTSTLLAHLQATVASNSWPDWYTGGIVMTSGTWPTYGGSWRGSWEGGSSYDMSGGTFNGPVVAGGTATIRISGNFTMNGRLYPGVSTVTNIDEGTITEDVAPNDGAVVNLNRDLDGVGPNIGWLDYGHPCVAPRGAAINVYGYGLAKSSTGGTYNQGYVSGFWDINHTSPFNIPFQDNIGTGSLCSPPWNPNPTAYYVILNEITEPIYTVTVNGGTGGGNYLQGWTVNVAATPGAGQAFNYWSGDTFPLTSIYLTSSTFAMPAANVSLTVNYAPQLNLSGKTWWLGNTWGGGIYGTPYKEVPVMIDDVYVEASGTTYTVSGADEGGRETAIYTSAGDQVGDLGDLFTDGRWGGDSIVADANYAYITMTQEHSGATGPPIGTTWYCVRRYNKTGANPFKTGGAAWTGGAGWDQSMLVVNTTQSEKPQEGNRLKGLAIYNGELFVSDPANNRIKVYNTASLGSVDSNGIHQPARWFAVAAAPGELAIDNVKQYLWVIKKQVGTTPGKVMCYKRSGQTCADITSVTNPIDVAWNPGVSRLMVADGDPVNQVLFYQVTTSGSTLFDSAKTLGTSGGIYAGTRGLVDPAGLKFNGLSGIGADSAGNVYVSTIGWNANVSTMFTVGAGTMLQKFNTSKVLQWNRHGLEFVDCADADPDNPTQVYTKDGRYDIDYTQAAPGLGWTHKAYTVDRVTYPDDPRLQTEVTAPDLNSHTAAIYRVEGQKVMTVRGMHGRFPMAIWRFSPANPEIAVPAAIMGNESPDIGCEDEDDCPDLQYCDVTQVCKCTGDQQCTVGQYCDATGRCSQVWPPGHPTDGTWIWVDANGNGQFDDGYSSGALLPYSYAHFMDEHGNIWYGGGTGEPQTIRKFVMSGLNASGVPQYSMSNVQTFTNPSDINSMERVAYISLTNTMYLAGYTPTYHRGPGDSVHGPDSDWGGAGTVLYRYDNWGGTPNQRWGVLLPYVDNGTGPAWMPEVHALDLAVEGDYVFVAMNIPPRFPGSFFTSEIRVYRNSDGSYQGTLQPTTDGVGDYLSFMDTRGAIRAQYVAALGIYAVFIEDDLQAKVQMYKFDPGLRPADNPATTAPGLNYKYYQTDQLHSWKSLPDFAAMTPAASGVTNANTFDLSEASQNDYFGFKYTGYIQVPTDGTYTFYTNSNEGSQLYIGETVVVNNNNLHAAQEKSGVIGLTAGKHLITVLYFENDATQSLSVSYSGPGIAKQVIPDNVLSSGCTGFCQVSYCSEPGSRCTWNNNCGTGGCCSYTCSVDPSCTVTQACPANACSCAQ
ncbi:MAG TPA: PA14 domain-containing protein [Candidatus Polarisedimenticolia bacterium]|jgi:hypothetical protein|nr:PA14 domain-containing protein [Candidatus Polarisedimenticolia bacterium]